MPELPADRYQLWRMPEVVRRTGMCKSKVYTMVRDGRFPSPRAVGGSVAWWSSEVMDWIEALPIVGQKGEKPPNRPQDNQPESTP